MKVTSAILFTTALFVGSALAKHSSSSSDDSSSSSSSSSSDSSSSKSSSSSGSSSSSSSSSDSSSSSSSSSASKSKKVEDYGINGCQNEEDFTILHGGFRHYDQIAKDNKLAAFLATSAEIKANSSVVSKIKKSKKKQTLALRVTRDQYQDLKKIKNKKKKLAKAVKKIAKDFKKSTGLSLVYVMLPTGASEKVVKAFNKNKLTVISKAEKVTKVKNAKIENFRGVVVVETKSATQKDLKNLKKAFKKSSVAGISLKECIPKKSVAKKSAVESGTETETDADALNIKSANMKAAETDADETDAEAEATNATNAASNAAAPATTTDGKTKKNSATSVAVSSVMSVAAIAAVAVFLL